MNGNQQRPAAIDAMVSPWPAIPATFTAVQAEGILALKEIHAYDGLRAAAVLDSLAPYCFSEAQARCIRDMLLLNQEDFFATLADAMESCVLRDQLLARTNLHEEEI